jgi:hypothetical protein
LCIFLVREKNSSFCSQTWINPVIGINVVLRKLGSIISSFLFSITCSISLSISLSLHKPRKELSCVVEGGCDEILFFLALSSSILLFSNQITDRNFQGFCPSLVQFIV